MRRSPLTRAAATLLSLLFLLAWGEPVALHPCPMHDGLVTADVGQPGARETPVSAAVDVAEQGAHADHGARLAPVDASVPAPEAPSHADAHLCQCLGHCCSSTGVVMAPIQAVRWHAVVTRLADPPTPAVATFAAAPRPHALPFANGPPRLA